MLAEGYEHLDRTMSMSNPQYRDMLQRRRRGLSTPPVRENTEAFLAQEHKDRIIRSFSAAPQLNRHTDYTSAEEWVPPVQYSEVTPLRKDSVAVPQIVQEQKKKKLTWGSLMILLYFWTCGGPFGVEPAVGAGGALLTWVCMVIAAFCWSLPQAIMAAELSLMMDVNGGNIVWVKRAFGDFVAFVNAQIYLVLNLSTLALLVYFFVQYIPGVPDSSLLVQWVVRSAFVLAVILVNLVGLEMLARLSTLFLVIIFSPFLVQMIAIVVLNVPINFSNLVWIPETSQIDFGTLISTVVWSFGGFDSIGSVAGEVSGGKKTFLIGVMGSFPLVLLNYVWPIMLDFIIDRKLSHWEAGYFNLIVFKYFPAWLGIWFTISSAISNFAQCASGLAPVAWNVWAMARGEETGVSYLPVFLAWEWQRKPGGTIRPIAGILFTGIAILAISAIDYKILLEVFLLLRICNLLMEYGALIYLKIIEPDTPRPFKVPGGVPGAIMLVIPTLLISGVSIYYAEITAIRMGGIIIGVIICIWPFSLLGKSLLNWGKEKKIINF